MNETIDCRCCANNARERQNWAPGPWHNEPDRLAWQHAGLPCILHRGGVGAWCGYVGIDPDHPLHSKGLEDASGAVDVHGDITYAEACSGHICHVPAPGESENLWWLGFDCCHAWDASPSRDDDEALALMSAFGDAPDGEHYWTLAEAKAETERLAEQLAAMKERT